MIAKALFLFSYSEQRKISSNLLLRGLTLLEVKKKEICCHFSSSELQYHAGNQNDEVSITGEFSSATNIATPADMSMADDELAKSLLTVKYETKDHPMIQRESGRYTKTYGATAAMKYFN